MSRYVDHGEMIHDTETSLWIPKSEGNSDYDELIESGVEFVLYEPEQPTLDELQSIKISEIRAAALERGTAGAKIIGSVEPHLAYRMALTPDDVTYLQLANTVARMEAEVTGTQYADATAEIKEKWLEDGVCRTKLHTAVPLPVHDAVLLQAVLQAAEISRHLEELIQAVNDAATTEDVEAVSW